MIRRLLYGIRRYTIDILSLDSMSSEYHILATNYIFLMVYATLESVFVNTLLYRINPDISIVILYRGIIYISSALTMHIAAYIGQKKTPVIVIRLGGMFYLIMYACLFFGMDNMQVMMYFTAVFSGLGGAFYWAGHNMLVPHYTTTGNRDIAVSILGIIQGVATLFVPIISGSLISLSSGLFGSTNTGYRIMFGLGMITVIAHVRYQRKLPIVVQLKHKSELKLALKLFRRKITYKLAMCYEFLRGFREGTFIFILNMLLFEIITSESLVGLNAFLTGIMAITGAWVYGKLVKPTLRTRYAVISTTVMLVFCSLLLVNSAAPSVMVFAMVNSFFALFISNISSNSTIDVITQTATDRKCIGESVAIREVFLCLGRISGLFVFTLFPSSMIGRIYAMLILTVSQYVFAFFVGLTSRVLNRKNVTLRLITP